MVWSRQCQGVWSITDTLTETTSWTPSQRIWSAAGQRRTAGPASVRQDSEVGDGAHTHPVHARPVEDAGTVEAVTGAYAAKDGDSP